MYVKSILQRMINLIICLSKYYLNIFVIAIQQKLLSVCAERSEDTMEHCRLVLLLLNRFPQSSTELAVRALVVYIINRMKLNYY